MDDEAKKAKNEYMKEYLKKYRKENKEKIKEINERYWKKKAEEIK